MDKELVERPPTALQMGKVYKRLILNTLQNNEDYAKSMSEELNPGENESNTLAWYSENELEDIKEELLVDVYLMAKEAINLYKECA